MKNEEPKFELDNLSPEDGKSVALEIDTALNKYSAQLVVMPIINPNGTLGAKVEIFKKVPVKNNNGAVPSPFMKNGEDKENGKSSTNSSPEKGS